MLLGFDNALLIRTGFALFAAYTFTAHALPRFLPKLLNRGGLGGVDLNKQRKDPPQKVPEAAGVVAVFGFTIFCAFFPSLHAESLSCMCAGFLGFMDNVIDLEWRWKLWIPVYMLLPLVSAFFERWGVLSIRAAGHSLILPKIASKVLIVLFAIFC